jgi:uncharacterized membrane protein YgdD (TMEM256/DUF423 family)
MNPRACVAIAAVALALAVLLGAFGAHALRARLGADQLAIFRTAVDYHFWHALGLLATGTLMLVRPGTPGLSWVAGFLTTGLILFCGSLYLLALGAPEWVGTLTPVGGLAFCAAWILLALAAVRLRLPER